MFTINKTPRLFRLISEGKELLEHSSPDSPRLDAEILLSRALDMERLAMLAGLSTEISLGVEKKYRLYLERRKAGEPVAYITGEKEFFESVFKVNSSVLIPRPETEIMVEAILKRFGQGENFRVCEIGTGCGCIALSLAKKRPLWDITATDISAGALDAAVENAASLKIKNVKFVRSDLFTAVEGKFDLIVSNPPYVDEAQKDALQVEVRDYEPSVALYAEDGGLSFIKELIKKSPGHLNDKGIFFCEIGFDQKEETEKLLDEEKWTGVKFLRDLAGHYRVVSAALKVDG